MPSKLTEKLWNCRADIYEQCKHPALQKFVDFIKDIYLDINSARQTYVLTQTERIREVMDIHLQRRQVEHLIKKVYNI